MSFATLAGAAGSLRVIEARVRLPRWGVWSALVSVDRDTLLAGSVTLTMGSLVLVGTVRRGDTFVGRGEYLIVGGANGWGKTIPPASYRGPETKLSTLAQDAARVVGETVDVDASADVMVGPFARVEGPASRVLSEYAPERWWVEIDGVTHVGDRSSTPAPSPRVLDFDPALGIATVSDDAAIFLPGQAFASGTVTGTIATVAHELARGKLRTDLYFE